MLIIELTENHWFSASYLSQGQSTSYILKDKGNKLYKAVEKIMTPPKPKKSFCDKCAGMMFPMAIGNCSACAEMTSSIALKFCRSCALKQGVCQACGKKVK